MTQIFVEQAEGLAMGRKDGEQMLDFYSESIDETFKLEFHEQTRATHARFGVRDEGGVLTDPASWNGAFQTPQEALADYAAKRLQGAGPYRVRFEEDDKGLTEKEIADTLEAEGVTASSFESH